MASLYPQVADAQEAMAAARKMLDGYFDGSQDGALHTSIDLPQLVARLDSTIAALQRLRDEAAKYRPS